MTGQAIEDTDTSDLFECLTCGKVSHTDDLNLASLDAYADFGDFDYFCTCGSFDLKRLDFEEEINMTTQTGFLVHSVVVEHGANDCSSHATVATFTSAEKANKLKKAIDKAERDYNRAIEADDPNFDEDQWYENHPLRDLPEAAVIDVYQVTKAEVRTLFVQAATNPKIKNREEL
jgi:hypothetical protein